MKRWKRNSLFLLLIIIAIILVYFNTKLSMKKEVELLSSTIDEELARIVELSSVKYNYTNVVSFKDSKKLSGLSLPFTTKAFLIKYSGYVKAGVDLDSIETEVVDNKTIKVKIDKPKVLDNVIMEEDVYIYDEKSSVFNKLSFNDLYDVLIEEKSKLEEELVDKGLLKDAKKNTEEILDSLFKGMGFEDIGIIFK